MSTVDDVDGVGPVGGEGFEQRAGASVEAALVLVEAASVTAFGAGSSGVGIVGEQDGEVGEWPPLGGEGQDVGRLGQGGDVVVGVEDGGLVGGGGVQAAAFDDELACVESGAGDLVVVHLDGEEQEGLGAGPAAAQEVVALGGEGSDDAAPEIDWAGVDAPGVFLEDEGAFASSGDRLDDERGEVGLADAVDAFEADQRPGRRWP